MIRTISVPIVLSAALGLWASRVPARAQSAASPDIGTVCRDAADHAERQQGLPAGLLLAIGRQESGRWHAATGQVLPWPFSVNAAGESRFFNTQEEAVAFVAARQAVGVQSIDVGCFQINLRHHPAAFATLTEAFDPDANGQYAASFLTRLHAQTGSWEAVVGRYHSATAALADPYKSAVLSLWKSASPARVTAAIATGAGPWRQLVAGIAVQRPGAPVQQLAALPGAGLPHVITLR